MAAGPTARRALEVHRDADGGPGAAVIIFGVLHDIADGHPENAYALVFTLPATVLAILWWLPATTRAMTARRMKREPVPPVPQARPGGAGVATGPTGPGQVCLPLRPPHATMLSRSTG